MRRIPLLLSCAAFALVGAACSRGADPEVEGAVPGKELSASSAQPSSAPSLGEDAEELPPGVSERPSWLGERPLPLDARGFGVATSTPKILRDRRLVTDDFFPPPDDPGFLAGIGAVPADVLRRSTWTPACPVAKKNLAYLRMTFWGFDGRPHAGEMIVHKSVAPDLLGVFQTLYRELWPIEEMRVTSAKELKARPTGDGNNTTAFVCRDERLSDEWSQHAYGLAVDVNPFHNPYVRGDLTLPELAIAYWDRDWSRPGMIRAGDVVTEAFKSIGWEWGGDWTSSKDWMHFSKTGG